MSIELSQRIKELRKAKGYTQKELADLLSLAQTSVANYENGTRFPDTEKLQKLADIFEVTLDYLVGRKENHIHKNTLSASAVTEDFYETYLRYLLEGDVASSKALIVKAFEAGIAIDDIYFKILEKSLKEIGALWERGSIDVWKEHHISEVTLDLMREMKAKSPKAPKKGHYCMAVTAGAEQHNIGLRMITDMLELKGWLVAYLGSNLPVASLLNAIKTEKPDIIAISVTMEYHLDSAENIIRAIRDNLGGKAPKIIIGGAAFVNNKGSVNTLGADYYASTAEDLLNLFL
jgi:MerR family transcriptional regulator, light-induced transcriptional regulator